MSRLIDADALKFTEYLGMDEPVISKSEIDAAPTVEPKRGEWEYHGGDDDMNLYGFCSNCFFNADEDLTRTYRYCPNCGADMRGETK